MSINAPTTHYYNEAGLLIGIGRDILHCDSDTGHSPHIFDNHLFWYGPKLCPGLPEADIYDQPLRKPIYPNREET